MEKYEKGNKFFRLGEYENAIIEYELSLKEIQNKEEKEETLKLKIFLNLSLCNLKIRNYEVNSFTFLSLLL